jgi:hypothetical protein
MVFTPFFSTYQLMALFVNPCFAGKLAFHEIYLVSATLAKMFLFKLVGKNLPLGAAFRALAEERAQALKTVETGTMFGCRHFCSSFPGQCLVTIVFLVYKKLFFCAGGLLNMMCYAARRLCPLLRR